MPITRRVVHCQLFVYLMLIASAMNEYVLEDIDVDYTSEKVAACSRTARTRQNLHPHEQLLQSYNSQSFLQVLFAIGYYFLISFGYRSNTTAE